jgi:gamma-glutamyltranspeptidase/glutathione hydrolase
MPPPSSGGIALEQMLGMLEDYDLRNMGLHSTAYIHTVAEAMRRAFHDRALYLGDPDFTDVPQAELTDPVYIDRMMANFDPKRASVSSALPPGLDLPTESTETTHFSVADDDGNAVVCTTTLNGHYGNGVTVSGAGFLLNNQMDDFAAKVGVKNMFDLIQGEANAIKPGKRPLSSMTPTIVLRDRRPYLLTGSPGGPTIISSVLHVLLNVIDHELPLTLAVDAPRFHHQWKPDRISHEAFFTSPDTLNALRDMGHEFGVRRIYAHESNRTARVFGDAQSIHIEADTGLLLGVNDLRNPLSGAAGF